MTLYSKIEGHGKPLVIIHGFLGTSDNWKTLGAQYAGQDFQTHLLDLRNHGRSFHSDVFNYEAMAEDLLNYCLENNLDKVSIIGHSMGGKVAMLFAVKNPAKMEKLIVGDIGPKYYPPHHDEILAGLNAVDFTKKPQRSDVEAILKPYIPDYGTRQFLMKNLYWPEPGQLAFRFNLRAFNKEIEQIGTALDQNAVFGGPTLFLRGANSGYIVEGDLETIRHHFPHSEITTIENAGHWLHADNPNAFFTQTIAFLKSKSLFE